ncbi:MAG: TonB-dependent receptor plug domain-containing protein [Methylococcaceae bacterium]|nr:TonB-dependent receptor plug domain-containing protein [Methylococcaceae bacterium]
MNNCSSSSFIFNSQQCKCLPFLLCLCTAVSVNAEENNKDDMDKLFDEPLEKVLDYKIESTKGSTGIKTSLTKAPSSIKIFNEKDIAQLNARTVSDVLRTLAGVQIQIKSNNRLKIWIRGSQSEFNNKIGLYVDNTPYRNVFGGFPIDEEIPIESIKSIEVIKGPSSALYGANAFSGVINIKTFMPKDYGKQLVKDGEKTLVKEGKKNLVKGGVGERDTALAYISLGHNFEGLAKVLLEGKFLTTDGRKPRFDSTGEANHRTGDQDLNHLRFKASALDDKLLFSASYNHFENVRVDKASHRDNSRKNKNLRFSLAFEHAFNKVWEIDLHAYYTNTERREFENNFQRIAGNRGDLAESFEFVDETEMMGFKATTTVTPSDDNAVHFGFEYKRERLATSEFFDNLTGETLTFVEDPTYQKIALNSYSFFIQARQNLWSKDTQFTAGLRFDKLDLFADQFSYRFGLTHSFLDDFYVKLLYGTAYRAPNFVEFARAPTGSDLPDVENMETLEFQLGYKNDELGLSADATFYYNQYNDFIFRKNSFHENSQNLSAGVFSNVDDLDIIGADFESKWKIDENWSTFLNIGWSNSRSEGQEQLMPLLTNWTLASGVDWTTEIGSGTLSFNNHIVAYSNRTDWSPDLWDAGQQQRYDNRGDQLNDGYLVWNTGLHYKQPLGDALALSVDFTVHNLLDNEYYTQSLTPPSSDRIANFDTQYQGRHGRLSVSLSF